MSLHVIILLEICFGFALNIKEPSDVDEMDQLNELRSHAYISVTDDPISERELRLAALSITKRR